MLPRLLQLADTPLRSGVRVASVEAGRGTARGRGWTRAAAEAGAAAVRATRRKGDTPHRGGRNGNGGKQRR
jgi:hypothetical protein